MFCAIQPLFVAVDRVGQRRTEPFSLRIAKDTIDPLLGAAPDESLVHAIASEITGYDGILGIHDLMVHDYGPGRRFASAHAEVDYRMNILDAHELLSGMQAGVGAVIASVVWDMGGSVVKQKDAASIVIMLAAFVAVCVFRVNVVYIILVCIGLGVLRTLLARRKKA